MDLLNIKDILKIVINYLKNKLIKKFRKIKFTLYLNHI